MDLTIQQVQQNILPILKKAGVTGSSLVGSYIRGEANKNSNVDILVDFPKIKAYWILSA